METIVSVTMTAEVKEYIHGRNRVGGNALAPYDLWQYGRREQASGRMETLFVSGTYKSYS